MQVTTQSILKILPLEDAFKAKLVAEYDQMPLAQRFALEQIAWDIYDAYVLIKTKENLEVALLSAEEGQDTGIIDGTFFNKIREQTEKEIHEKGVIDAEKIDLQSARTQLTSLLDGQNKPGN